MIVNSNLLDKFLSLLQRHVPKLHVSGSKATGLAPCHGDSSPSLSVDLEKCVWFCHACGRGGGVKAFAELVGECWISALPKPKTKTHRAALARRRAEEEAREILKRRREEWEESLLEQHREVHEARVEALDILKLFHRHPELHEEIPELPGTMEQQYAEAADRLATLGAILDRELTV